MAKAIERILTIHPDGKKGVNIEKEKYDLLRSYILKNLKILGTITYKELDAQAVQDLTPTFEGSVRWYFVSVKLDLEARGIIERIPNTSPHQIRLK